MKRFLIVIVALALVSPVLAQEGAGEAKAAAAVPNTLDELWSFQDAVPMDTGAVDLRLSFGWESGVVTGGTGDNFVLTPSLYWGCCEDVEFSVSLPSWLGDGGDRGPWDDGNWDTNMGVLWRLMQQSDSSPLDLALAGNFRIPTGDRSNGVDYEMRLAMTHSYDSGIRSHFNLWGEATNGENNGGNDRNFQYGAVVGVDYPLCAEGAVRLVIDYVHRSSVFEGENNWNLAEIGWEWDMNDADRLGVSVQLNLDRSNDAPNAGAVMTYAHALTF